LRHFFR